MKNNRYISCTDKRVVITGIISVIVLIITIILLSKGGYAPGVLKNYVITGTAYWVIVITLFYVSLLISTSLISVILFGIITTFLSKRNKR